MKNICIVFFLFIFFLNTSAQKRITTLGLQYKPIFPVAFLKTGKQSYTEGTNKIDVELKKGFAFGMTIRKGISDLISLETGINYVKRNYSLALKNDSLNIENNFRLIAYEIPLTASIYVRAGEQVYLNAGMGACLDMFASNVATYDDNFVNYAARNKVFQPAVVANVGVEYRTIKSGYIYLGATFHRPFNFIYTELIEFPRTHQTFTPNVGFDLLGSYLTLDLRYYFHEDPQKKMKKK